MNIIAKEELLNMSEDDYMNDTQLTYFKHLLEEQKNAILVSIDESKDNLVVTEKDADETDVATKIEYQQLELKRMDRERKLLNKISKTIELIKNGEYGYCESTGEPIGLERLLARPTATLSVAAKERQEYREKTSGLAKKYHQKDDNLE
jgi:DnaK suppressor protein